MDFLFEELYEDYYRPTEQPESSPEEVDDGEKGSLDSLMRDYDGYGRTPPRQRHRTHHKQIKKKLSMLKLVRGTRRPSPSTDHQSNVDSEEDGGESRKRTDKRSKYLLRNSERSLKLDGTMLGEGKDMIDGSSNIQLVGNTPHTVESASRFLSLKCELITKVKNKKCSTEGSMTRAEFHEYLEDLLKTGNCEIKNYNSQVSEDHLWQTDLHDMIWLELQAWRAGRSVTQQDQYLCQARRLVPQILEDIINYRFERRADRLSAHSTDSGVDLNYIPPTEPCSGCHCLFCPSCMEAEVQALKDVSGLLIRLDQAEALFPSSKSFGSLFPQYKSPEFSSRIKAMCLWYNMTRQHRLKTLLVGKQLLAYAEGTQVKGIDSTLESTDVMKCLELNSFENYAPLEHIRKLFFETEDGNTVTYRKFLEEILKTKGLKKSFQFMEQFQTKLLRKGRIALEKPSNDENCKYTGDELLLRKYGCWSEAYQSLNLPCFKSAFWFLSRIPFDVIHEFLRLRLETKLEKPSSLSIRQLMKELRDGLKLAVVNKEMYLHHSKIALIECDEEIVNKYLQHVSIFDNTAKEVIQLYLSYLQQWSALTTFGKLQKNILEEEWKFITQTAPHFPDCEEISTKVFCNISCAVMKVIHNHIESKIEAILLEYSSNGDEEPPTPSSGPCFSSNAHNRKTLKLCRGLQALFFEIRDRTMHILTLMRILIKYVEDHKKNKLNEDNIDSPLHCLREEALKMCDLIKKEISVVEGVVMKPDYEDCETVPIQNCVREVIHQMYRYSFEFFKDIGKIVHFEVDYIRDMFHLALSWLNFVKVFCEMGRGFRPRWANFGIEFIVYISNPKFTQSLTCEEFEGFKESIQAGVDYIKGAAQTGATFRTLSTPAVGSPHLLQNYKHSLSQPDPLSFNSLTSENTDKGENSSKKYVMTEQERREERIQQALDKLESKLEHKLREEELIGTVLSSPSQNSYDKKFIKPRAVTFGWQRGIKIGQGRFGKVYTAVNNDTGELMAMKEISLSPNDVRTINSVATELKIFEGIIHENLVRYYGAEIHRDELLIFMELCPEGTLEGLVMASENGLPESIVRRYTKQLSHAVLSLHRHSIVHRDIKPANIFLAAEGTILKLGDFGSAVKIRAHTTAPGELKGFVGTQAYMAPEVFMKTNTVGHGRAADIWSLGCVVIEMSSGKRPWSEYDSNYQIMFKVGMGETPSIPEGLSEEGKNFIKQCVQHSPKKRVPIDQLIHHTFLKVECDEESLLCTMPSELEEYLKLGIKR